MDQFLTGLFSGLGGILAVLIPAYLGYRKQKDAHEEAMVKIRAEADEKIKSAEDKRQNEAFDRLKDSFDTLKMMFDDLLTRTQKLESDHAACEQRCTDLHNEITALKKG